VAVAESCMINRNNKMGAEIKIEYNQRKDFELFSESQSRVIISASSSNIRKIEKICKEYDIPLIEIGIVKGKSLKINDEIKVKIDDIEEIYYNSISNILSK
jgi:phosphoribosylformylglycinamidine synthase subunit PurL